MNETFLQGIEEALIQISINPGDYCGKEHELLEEIFGKASEEELILWGIETEEGRREFYRDLVKELKGQLGIVNQFGSTSNENRKLKDKKGNGAKEEGKEADLRESQPLEATVIQHKVKFATPAKAPGSSDKGKEKLVECKAELEIDPVSENQKYSKHSGRRKNRKKSKKGEVKQPEVKGASVDQIKPGKNQSKRSGRKNRKKSKKEQKTQSEIKSSVAKQNECIKNLALIKSDFSKLHERGRSGPSADDSSTITARSDVFSTPHFAQVVEHVSSFPNSVDVLNSLWFIAEGPGSEEDLEILTSYMCAFFGNKKISMRLGTQSHQTAKVTIEDSESL
jgi:hypothetical protein